MNSNPYYQPYWNPSDELEHYGVLGMKWGKKKAKTNSELVGAKFGDVKVYQTGAWIDANNIKLPSHQEMRAAVKNVRENKLIQKGVASVAKTLAKEGKKAVKAISQKVVNLGKKVIDTIKKATAKKKIQNEKGRWVNV